MAPLQEFRRTLYALACAYPTIRRGGMHRRQLVDVARRIAAGIGLRLRVDFGPWPWPATLQRADLFRAVVLNKRMGPLQLIGREQMELF